MNVVVKTKISYILESRPRITRRQLPSCPFYLPWCPPIFFLIDGIPVPWSMMPFSLAVVCPSAVISHPRIIPHLDPLVITNTTNLFRSIDKTSSNCKCLGAPPWRSKFAVVPFQTCWKCCGALLLTRPSMAIFAVPLLISNSRPEKVHLIKTTTWMPNWVFDYSVLVAHCGSLC